MSQVILTKDFLKELFEYKDGELYWKLFSRKKGSYLRKAGFITHEGVYKVKIKNKIYALHRLIFRMFHDYLPSHISHINGNRIDNRIENLKSFGFNNKEKKERKPFVKGLQASNRHSFVYRWDSIDGKFYIGKHKGFVEDGYICGNHQLKKDIKCNSLNWKRTILLITENEVDAYRVETMLIRLHKNNSLCLNGMSN